MNEKELREKWTDIVCTANGHCPEDSFELFKKIVR